MQRNVKQSQSRRSWVDIADRGADPEELRTAIKAVNHEIVALQAAGEDVPTRLMRLSEALAAECVAHSQGR
ncbi:MAG: hypothetical protein R3D68_02555 [Hyphomicrobiaceae bacterium]